ncbi:hypothetical protein [Mycolicibacterium tusciae]|nr:hypothetical protein [Mycolicibacterium tusciae]
MSGPDQGPLGCLSQCDQDPVNVRRPIRALELELLTLELLDKGNYRSL